MLLVLRCRIAPGESKCVLRFAQLCDNQAVTFAALKMLSAKQPLCFVLQALGFYCCEYRVALSCSHIAGERNVWADCLSRDVVPAGFNVELRRSLNIQDLLSKPWFSARWLGVLVLLIPNDLLHVPWGCGLAGHWLMLPVASPGLCASDHWKKDCCLVLVVV